MGLGWGISACSMPKKVFCVVFLLHLQSFGSFSLNPEGMALLKFRSGVEFDPYGVFNTWDPKDDDPCNWSGIYCSDDRRVEILNLKELSLEGALSPELGELGHLKALVLYKNNFSGVIPKEIGRLTMLQLMDLRNNNLDGPIPKEIEEMLSLKQFLFCGNKFQGVAPSIEKSSMFSELNFEEESFSNAVIATGYINRKVGPYFWQNGLGHQKKASSFMCPFYQQLLHFLEMFPLHLLKGGFSDCHGEKHRDDLQSFAEPYIMQNVHRNVNSVRRRLLQVTSNRQESNTPSKMDARNLPAAPLVGPPPRGTMTVPSTGSGSFPAIPHGKVKPSPESPLPSPASALPATSADPQPGTNKSTSSEKITARGSVIIIIAIALLLIFAASMYFMCRRKGVATIGPWKTGLSGQLQNAFVTGVPKLHRAELEAACEDFSNIITTFPHSIVFKGTLSNGLEISVASTAIKSDKDWSKQSEIYFRRKVDALSRINHKNFVNLIGYCEEDEPFMRMMVFEYASSGTLYEHLHGKDFDHLDWNARTRIIMGIGYCLQYMHHDLNPPVAHPDLQTSCIFLTDDYAAKVCDTSVWKEVAVVKKTTGDDEMDPSDLAFVDPGSNVYSFGLLMLEIISGKLPNFEEQGSLLNLVLEYLKDKSNTKNIVDLSLKDFKSNEFDIICEVIKDCTGPDPKMRPTMKEVIAKLREVIGISPEAATPRLSPLWWAELEILSMEAS
ncbi:Non-specific serine/threonine protein kinase protein [Dioscorea alata]|uniref:Non-specific serine/threonine protein kinase protein n=1 Tax=Dioscorea alata TaxID=55571 RepID=A0ACB7W3W2_DIOAL|nr:Non-specific serine/threonine protein kinase protein [Dioscorea alata]